MQETPTYYKADGSVSSQVATFAETNTTAYDSLQTPNYSTATRTYSSKKECESMQNATDRITASVRSKNATGKHVEGDEESDNEAIQEGLMHGINSFWAILLPVSFTIILASILVVNYRNHDVEASMQTYLVYGESDQNNGGSPMLGRSLINALVIICVIAVLTFVMALLYKYNCIKFLAGYIMFASVAILSFVGGQLVNSIVNEQIGWILDWPSFVYILGNFGFGGVVSIFYQKGTPRAVQGAYLVLVSVILAWQFSMWPEFTTWIFCFAFACYDLCAVLTPCGPLRCLINLIQDKQTPLPGLLYEADVRDGVGQHSERAGKKKNGLITAAAKCPRSISLVSITSEPCRIPVTVEESDFSPNHCDSMEALIELLEVFYQTFSREDSWKATQVAEKFLDSQDRLWMLIYHKYTVCSCAIDIPCPVREKVKLRLEEDEEAADEDKTIKLGLGDFIFYSVLAGRAAIYDFSTFVVCFLSILLGLGGTLFLLSVLQKALPALPISIFLATIVYFWTRYGFVEMGDYLLSQGILL